VNKIRVGIIGMGNIGRHHADYLRSGKVSRCELTALCSRDISKIEAWRPLPLFSDANGLMSSGLVDAVLVATPHYDHLPLGLAALKHGLHLMVEKPIAAHKADAEKLVAAWQKQGKDPLFFGAMFQLRVEPRYAKLRQLIRNGELGDLARVNWIITDWYRTEAYYASGGWRATWKGEGGGLLLNQCLHNLDMLQWLCGMPARLRGFCQFGRYHDIEVEDNVTAYFEYPNGATGAFISSSGEAPGTNRLEIAGTKGKAVLERDKLTFTRNEVSMTEFSRKAKSGFARPEVWNVDIPFDTVAMPHAAVMQNFVDAILDGGALIAPGVEGINSVELANGIVFSSLTGKTLELPMSGAAFEKKLKALIAGSKIKKKVNAGSTEDVAGSFKR
jgi:predicted dehydrogenase